MTNSTVFPNTLIKSNGKIFLIDKNSIVESEIEGIKSYTYEMYELPISDRDNLEGYIGSNYDILLDFAKNYKITIPKTELEILQNIVDQLLIESLGGF